jgi:hypothetical protein
MTNIDERAEARMALQKILWALDIDPETININSMGLFEDYIMQARATLPTAEVSEDEVVKIMRDAYRKSRGLTFTACARDVFRALCDNGYKIVRVK